MTDTVGVYLTGARELALKFERMPQDAHAGLLEVVEEETAELKARVLGAAPRRTGKLASEVVSRVRDSANRIVGTVGVSADFAKAAAEEYGAHKGFTRRAHQMRLDHAFGRVMNAPEIVTVKATPVVPNIAARNFLRGPLEGMRTQFIMKMDAALEKASSE